MQRSPSYLCNMYFLSLGSFLGEYQTLQRALPLLSGILAEHQSSSHVPLHLSQHPATETSKQPEECAESFCRRLDVLRSSVFISRLVTTVQWSISSEQPTGTVSRVMEMDHRWSSKETCHRLTRLPAGGLSGIICFQLKR